MCGLFGMSRAIHSDIPDGRRAILAGLTAIEHRGTDSTGVAWTRGKGKRVWYDKRVGRAKNVAPRLDLDRKLRIHSAIGHTRAATKGSLTYDNAHPVVADNIVLAHNGVLWNDDELIRMSEVPRVGKVDSFALAAVISTAESQFEVTPWEVLELVEGDAACLWFDSHDPMSLHMARLYGRPLTLGWTKAGDLLVSSTKQTLLRTAKAIGVTLENEMLEPKEGTYMRAVNGTVVQYEYFKPAGYSYRSYSTATYTPLGQLPLTADPYVGYTDDELDAMSDQEYAELKAQVEANFDRAVGKDDEPFAAGTEVEAWKPPRGYAHGITDLVERAAARAGQSAAAWMEESLRDLGPAVTDQGPPPTHEEES
jgi:glucosamine 6-phosphate synthetase-like amidotransferase/phosphosugar isomerase protein